jgi:DNA-binding LytR/AlgR family response regulator
MKKFVFLKEKGILHKVFLEDILYFEALKDYVQVFTGDRNIERRFVIHSTISSIPEKFPEFIQIGRSHVINPEKIDRIDGPSFIVGKKIFFVGEKFKEEFLKSIDKYRI